MALMDLATTTGLIFSVVSYAPNGGGGNPAEKRLHTAFVNALLDDSSSSFNPCLSFLQFPLPNARLAQNSSRSRETLSSFGMVQF